jgi:uncharacterized repeat protein (TIGR01451 family)
LAAAVVLVATTMLFVAPGPDPVAAAPGEDDTPADNPDLEAACGLDILVILDESGSIATANATDDVQRAFKAFTRALQNTGSRMAVAEFSTVARLPLAGDAQRSYTTVTNNTIKTVFDPYINSNFKPADRTHWEDAFRVGRFFLPRPTDAKPHLTVFITDGNPNVVVNENNVTRTEYETKVPLNAGAGETTNTDSDTAAARAVPNANALKAQLSHILALAVGDGLSGADTLRRLESVSGPDVFPDDGGEFDISTTDVYREPDFAKLEDALRQAAFALCAPSVTVQKLLDQDPNEGIPPDSQLVPGADWQMDATVVPAPTDWVLPPDASGSSATQQTDAAGFATFQWTNAGPGESEFEVAETVEPAYVNRPGRTHCVFRTPDQPEDQELDIDVVDGGFSATIPEESIVTCTMVNELTPQPAVTIEKDTNGVDADEAPGPNIPLGDQVEWTYVVTNTGNVALNSVAVTDDQLGDIDCPQATLAVGADMTCTATGNAEPGQYENLATVTATGSGGGNVSDDDPSHYFGSQPGIDVEKSTNGEDADNAPGPVLEVGDTVTWEYVVTNTGNQPIADVELTDSEGVDVGEPTGDTDGDGVLDVDETWTYTATGEVEEGFYENVADVTGTDPQGDPVADSDPSHYFGELISVDIEKSTNLEDADEPTGPFVTVGGPVVWRYLITNTGNVPIRWAVTDDQAPFIFCPRPILVPGRSIACFSTARATEGQYENVGEVVGRSVISDATATDSDPSHYFGVQGGIAIEKSTNGDDADEAPGPFISPGGAVIWEYEVTNTGNSVLTDIVVTDDKGVTVECPSTELPAGESMTCTAAGTAEPDQYSNNATVTGTTPTGVNVIDDDPSHYFGDTPGINLEKDTNGVDADEAPGPFIPVGDAVTWSYVVTNSGNSELTNVTVTDDQGVEVACPQDTLAPGEVMTCTARGTAEIDQYENLGTVTASSPTGEVSDDDPSHYFGAVSEIDIEKYVNGQDADRRPGVEIPVGEPVVMTFEVTNPGNIPFRTVDVIDDQGLDLTFLGGDDNNNTELDPGEVWRYEADLGPATPGRYDNLGTVDGFDVLETERTDDDPVFAFVVPPPAPGLVIDKSPDRARVPEGGSHTFTITVTNTGEVDLVNVEVVDDQVPECNRVIGELPAGESFSYDCTVDNVTGRIHNVATASGETPDGDTVNDSDDAVVTPIPAGEPSPPPGEDCPDPHNPDCPDLPDTGGLPWWIVALGVVLAGAGGVIALAALNQRRNGGA